MCKHIRMLIIEIIWRNYFAVVDSKLVLTATKSCLFFFSGRAFSSYILFAQKFALFFTMAILIIHERQRTRPDLVLRT